MTFAIPAGVVTGVAVLLGHGLVHTSLDRGLPESQTTSVTILVFVGLFLVLVVESGGMRASVRRARLDPRALRRPRGGLSGRARVGAGAGVLRARAALVPADAGGDHLHDVRDRRAGSGRHVADTPGGERPKHRAPAPPAGSVGVGRMRYSALCGVWRSLVARSVRVGEVPSSNLGTPMCAAGALPAGRRPPLLCQGT